MRAVDTEALDDTTHNTTDQSLPYLLVLQRQFAFEATSHCIDEAYKAKGPFTKHACYFRTDR